LLDLKFTRRTKAVAFAAIRGENENEVEKCSNLELSKITARAKSNKISFNEEKSKVMLISRRKRKEVKEIKIYLHNKPLEQVTTIKYLGIIINNKLKFSEHISYAVERCTKLIHSLSKSAKVSCGLKHEALKTLYKGAILPLLLYRTPVWNAAMKYEYNKLKYIRVQRLINTRIDKAFLTTSSETLCILAGTTPITIKIEEVVQQHNTRKWKGSQTHLIDKEMEIKKWPHPADAVKIIKVNEHHDQTIQAYTDGSKNENGVESGVTIFGEYKQAVQLKFKLDNRCSNNQRDN